MGCRCWESGSPTLTLIPCRASGLPRTAETPHPEDATSNFRLVLKATVCWTECVCVACIRTCMHMQTGHMVKSLLGSGLQETSTILFSFLAPTTSTAQPRSQSWLLAKALAQMLKDPSCSHEARIVEFWMLQQVVSLIGFLPPHFSVFINYSPLPTLLPQPHWHLAVPRSSQACSYFRAFALAVLSLLCFPQIPSCLPLLPSVFPKHHLP